MVVKILLDNLNFTLKIPVSMKGLFSLSHLHMEDMERLLRIKAQEEDWEEEEDWDEEDWEEEEWDEEWDEEEWEDEDWDEEEWDEEDWEEEEE